MERLTDPKQLHRLIGENAREQWIPSLDQFAEWLADPDNLALVEGNDLALFSGQGSVHGHIFFASRGKQALTTARAMLGHVFDLGAAEVLGATPVKFKDALLFAQWLGFEKIGEEMRPNGKVILSRKANPKGVRKVA